MREIKYRLIKEGKIVGYELFLEGRWIYAYPDGIFNLHHPYIEHDEKNQYTGLKDKNGQEIYEGDILRIEQQGGGKTCISEVYWEQPEVRNDHSRDYESLNGYVRFARWNARSQNKWNYAMHEGNFEVIGNIY